MTAIVVTHNSSAYLERCLAGLSRAVDEVIVVDNASTDGTAELVERTFPGTHLIEIGRNAGFAAACNAGTRVASGRYLLFVNPDAWPTGNAVTLLVECARRNPQIGVLGPTLVNEDGSPQRSVFGYPANLWSLLAFAATPAVVTSAYVAWQRARAWARRPANTGGVELLGDETFLSGAALLIRADALDDVGGFDERFFFFSEEADLCFRMREAGWSLGSCRSARFVHVGASSSPASPDWRYAQLLRSYLLFLAKRDGIHRAQRARRLLVAVLLMRATLAPGKRHRQIKQAAASLRSSDVLNPMA